MKNNWFLTISKLLRGIAETGQFCFIGENVFIGKNVKLYPMSYIEDNVSIGDNTFIGYSCVIREGTTIGSDCSVGHLTVFEKGAKIANRVGIHSQCHICQGSVIEDDVFIAPYYVGTNTKTIDHGRGINPSIEGPTIKRAARIGAGVVLTPGVSIGENSFIGAGSLVSKDVPDREIWFGHPAKKKADVSDDNLL